MNLKNTVSNKRPSPEELENLLEKAGMKDDTTSSDITNEPIETEKVEKTVKINVILTESEHFIFKTYCGRVKVNMQDKAKELILKWSNEQPKLNM